MPHRLDTTEAVYFYENEFYPLSNFSAFRLLWEGMDFDTSEHAYHWTKFTGVRQPDGQIIQSAIVRARSAHAAFKIAQDAAALVRLDWPAVKESIMLQILWAKAEQHEYVRRKLLETGERLLVEDSWRDAWWGLGPDGTGANRLGHLWMEIRAVLRASIAQPAPDATTHPQAWCTAHACGMRVFRGTHGTRNWYAHSLTDGARVIWCFGKATPD